MQATVALEPFREAGFDRQLSLLEHCRLTRCSSLTYLEADQHVADVARCLALAGVRVVPRSQLSTPAAGLRVAIGLDLHPLDRDLDVIDVVEVRRVSLSHSSAVLLDRRIRWLAASAAKREQCRRLLHGEDVVLGWRRIAWCSASALRTSAVRQHFRPVVFDRGAPERMALRWSYASQNAIARWAFG